MQTASERFPHVHYWIEADGNINCSCVQPGLSQIASYAFYSRDQEVIKDDFGTVDPLAIQRKLLQLVNEQIKQENQAEKNRAMLARSRGDAKAMPFVRRKYASFEKMDANECTRAWHIFRRKRTEEILERIKKKEEPDHGDEIVSKVAPPPV